MASGLSPRDTVCTRPSYYPGSNHLGRILEQVRSELTREASKLQIIDTERHDDVISSAAGDPAAKSTTSPKHVQSTSSGGISSDASNSAAPTDPGTSTPTAQDDPGTSTPTAVSNDSDHECEELNMSGIEELIDGSDTDTVTESAAEVPTKKSTANPPQKSRPQPTKLSRGVEISTDVLPTKTAASGSLFYTGRFIKNQQKYAKLIQLFISVRRNKNTESLYKIATTNSKFLKIDYFRHACIILKRTFISIYSKIGLVDQS